MTQSTLVEFDIQFSFEPLYRFLLSKNTGKNGKKIYKDIIVRLEEQNIHYGNIDQSVLPTYEDLFQLIYEAFTGISDEGTAWGIGVPFLPTLVYASPLSYDFFIDRKTGGIHSDLIKSCSDIRLFEENASYCKVLEKVYGVRFNIEDSICRYLDIQTNTYRYVKIQYNTDFVDVQFNDKLPDIEIRSFQEDNLDLQYLKSVLPPKKLSFRGFAIFKAVDITEQHCLSEIRKILWSTQKTNRSLLLADLREALYSLIANREFEFGAIPFVRLNDKFIRGVGESLIDNDEVTDDELQQYLNEFVNNRKVIAIPDLSETKESDGFLYKVLKRTPYRTYISIPVYYQGDVYGMFELYTAKSGVFSWERFSILRKIYVELSQLMKFGHEIFQNRLDQIMSERFTVIQPSVIWKFKSVAFEYMKQAELGAEYSNIPIVFENVTPFFGAIDIIDSSLIRNDAIKSDWKEQLNTLKKLLKECNELSGHLRQVIENHISFLAKSAKKNYVSTHIIDSVKNTQKSILSLLLTEAVDNPALSDFSQQYSEAINPHTGKCTINDRNVDKSIKLLVNSIASHLESMNQKIQEIFPSYFEKFRTDGMEYDLFTGQSIFPDKTFNNHYLSTIRSIQLDYMIRITIANRVLIPNLPIVLYTTQLLLANPGNIDITFREDEKRFDVEGAHNFQYHMLKKRIEKSVLKGSTERLTQPDTIALVYVSDDDMKEYLPLIIQEVGKKRLGKIEYLELENIQGITEFKALRVHVE